MYKKAHELGRDYSVYVAVIVMNRCGRYYTYRSTKDISWLRSMAEIVSDVNSQKWKPDILEQENTYPLPKNLLPHDIESRCTV